MLSSFRRLITAALLAGSAMVSVPAWADETDPPSAITVHGHLDLVSDYRFRGLSRSSGDPAVQGGIEVSHVSGFYAGLAAASLDLGNVGPLTDPVHSDMQLDIYGGWTGPLAGGWNADVGLLYYAFPAGNFGKAEFFEPYASVSTTLGPLSGKLGVKYAWKQQALNFNGGRRDDNLYVHLDLGAGIPNTPVSLSARVGYTDGALSPKYATGETLDYAGGFDWALGASYAITPFLSVGGQYVGVQGRSIDGYSNDTVVGTLKLSF